jgi:hypothetical protein
MSRPKRPTTVSDFSSAEYWASRFTTETSFEWLLPSDQIIAFVLENFHPNLEPGQPITCLHIGCGTSDLGKRLEEAIKELHTPSTIDGQVDIQVIDSDYVAESIIPFDSHAESRQILPLDCLNLPDLMKDSPEQGWDLIIDKSTADAISCGPLIDSLEPLQVLLHNMAQVTRKGTRWISISYSATRFSHLEEEGEGGWKVVEKRFLASTSLPDGRRWRDKSGVERVVFEPETGIWGWILERA